MPASKKDFRQGCKYLLKTKEESFQKQAKALGLQDNHLTWEGWVIWGDDSQPQAT